MSGPNDLENGASQVHTALSSAGSYWDSYGRSVASEYQSYGQSIASSAQSEWGNYGNATAVATQQSSSPGQASSDGPTGLINSSTVKGDLWLIEAGGSMSCYPLSATAEGPGPRVGHASLLVGNAFIVYGGDTKIDENDVLDETLYLLNTCKLISGIV